MNNTKANTISSKWANEIESWRIAMKAMRLSPQTIELRIYHLRRLARAQLGESPWDVTRADLLEWTGKHDWRRETARAVRSSFRRFWAWGLSTSRTVDNVADVLPMIRPEQPQPRPAAPSIVVTAMKDADSRVSLMLRLANELGMRRSEVAQVHPENDLVQDLVGWALVVHGKGSRKRVLPLPDDLASLLRSAPAGYLFPSPAGGHSHPTGLARWFLVRSLTARRCTSSVTSVRPRSTSRLGTSGSFRLCSATLLLQRPSDTSR